MHVKEYHHTCSDSGYFRHPFRHVSDAYTVPVLDITLCNLGQATLSFKTQLLFLYTAANKLEASCHCPHTFKTQLLFLYTAANKLEASCHCPHTFKTILSPPFILLHVPANPQPTVECQYLHTGLLHPLLILPFPYAIPIFPVQLTVLGLP